MSALHAVYIMLLRVVERPPDNYKRPVSLRPLYLL
jgi:hypothetical protein